MPLNQSHLTSNVCMQCGQCCYFEEYSPNLQAQQIVLDHGLLCHNEDGSEQTLPVTLRSYKNSTYLVCGHLSEDNLCTNFDSDGTDLRPYDCTSKYCVADESINLVRPKKLDGDKLYPEDGTHIDFDIIKLIVDNVHGTNLSGGG